MSYWLFKTEPTTFSFDDLKAEPKKTTCWEGVRNYQARNMLRDLVKKKDLVFFYHSSCAVPGIVGIAEVVKEGYPDHHAFDPAEKYYDPDSDPDKPRWFMVDVRYKRKLKRTISLTELKEHAEALDGFRLIKRGMRLSVMPVDAAHWDYIVGLE